MKNSTNKLSKKHKRHKDIDESIKAEDRDYIERRNTYLNIISENIKVPADIINATPLITMHGRSSLFIENQKKILECTDTHIVIQASHCIINIHGSGLKIIYCTIDEMKLTGVISSVTFS